MKRAEASTVIRSPIDRVWALYLDIEGTTRWVPFVEEILHVSGPVAVGMTYRERTRLGGLRAVNEWRVVELDPPHRRVEESSSMAMDSTLILTFAEEGSAATRVRQVSELRSRLPPPLSWLQERAFAPVSARAMRDAIRGAKRVLEQP